MGLTGLEPVQVVQDVTVVVSRFCSRDQRFLWRQQEEEGG